MRWILCLVLILFTTLMWAGDAAAPFNMKLGLWEVTTTTSMRGAPPIPADILDKMTPEQRARMEQSMQAMGGAPRTHTEKTCETKEKLDKDLLFKSKDDNCTRTPVTSTTSTVEMKIHCTSKDQTTDGTMRFDAINPENVKGVMDMTSSGGGHEMKVKIDFAAHWLGPVCGDVK